MKNNSTFHLSRKIRILALFILLMPCVAYSQSVKVFAGIVNSQSHVSASALAADNNLATSAVVQSSSGLLGGIGAYNGYIELQFPSTLAANTTSYVKLTTDDNLLPSLLGGSLGGLLANVGGTVLLGNQEFSVQAKDGASVVLQGDSQDAGDFATNRLRIVLDSAGDYYIALTPSQPYSSIRIINRLGSLIGLSNQRSLNVYGAYYVSQADNCGTASYTSFDGSGLTLDLLQLNGAGVINPENAIDSDMGNYAQLNLGILNVAASVEQTMYFDGLSGTNDQFNIRLRIDPSLLGLGAANNIQIIAYNGPNIVQTTSLSGLLNLDLLALLQGNQPITVPFATSAPANRITVRYNALLNVNVQQSLDLFGVYRTPKVPFITDPFTQNATVCAGGTASLVAETATGYSIRWYNAAVGGTLLATTNSGQPYVTTPLNTNTAYFIAAVKNGCPEESTRVRINVGVTQLPTADDINIISPQTACQGNITLTPSSDIGGATVRYYTSQDKTQEITTGYSGIPGVTFSKNASTGALSISGLTAANSPYSFFIALTVNGQCENAPSTLEEVVVNYSAQLPLQLQATLTACGSANLRDAILNFDSAITYRFFDTANNEITPAAAASVSTSGTYYIQATNGIACVSDMLAVNVTVAPDVTLSLPQNGIVANTGSPVSLSGTSNGTIIWYDQAGNALPSNTAGPFATAGMYNFTAVATLGNCSKTGSIVMTVVSPGDCPQLTERRHANTQGWTSVVTGGVANGNLAVDGNPQTYATLTTGIGLLGVGSVTQTLQWDTTIASGTAATIKLGSQYSALSLLNGITVVATKRNASNIPVPIGSPQFIDGAVADLLSGENSFQYTFVPADNTGPKPYDGIRITVNSLVSVARNIKVYDAFYDLPVTQLSCPLTDAEDVLSGAVDLGIGAATSTVSVNNPYNAIDNSLSSFATMYSGAGVLAAARLTALFYTPSVISDKVNIRISKPSGLLSVTALNGLTIQPMLNGANSGPAIPVNSSLLTFSLNGGNDTAVLSITPTVVFDAVRIDFGGVAGVLDFINIHDIRRSATIQIDGADANNAIISCAGNNLVLTQPTVPCTTFIWYTAATGGSVVSTGNTFTIPASTTAGIHTYYIQPVRYGCAILERTKVSVTITATAPADAISSISVNGNSDTTICAANGNVTLSANLNNSVTLTNPVFYWYTVNGTTQTLVPGQTGPTLSLTGLAAGTYTYALGVSSSEYCQTAVADRQQVTFTISPNATSADIQANNAAVCEGTNAVITPSSALASPVFTYYLSNDYTQPITNGAVIAGATYTINPSGTLTVAGLTNAGSPYTYYISVNAPSRCPNLAGDFKIVTVTVGSLPAPTTGSSTQNFCSGNAPTVADLQVNEANVVFYATPTGGTALAPATSLTAGTYYAAIVDNICESATRLPIAVTIGNPAVPTTSDMTQDFCLYNTPTVSDIQVNEAGVVFYDAAVNGNVIPATAALTTGTYYAAIVDGTCQSTTRLAISITVNDSATPTTNDTTQDFCASDTPVVSDLSVNESNVSFFTTSTGGTALDPATALSNGVYYASLTNIATGCQSTVRLPITVAIFSVPAPTANNESQTFCSVNNPTIADIQVNGTGVIFYDAASGGNLLDPSSLLSSGTYYAAAVQGTCESTTRLAINATITNPATPTTNSSAQSFCAADNPTVANLQVNEAGVIFYTSATGGTALPATTPLANGTYYAAIADGSCESPVRLLITVQVTDPAVPTTNDTTQDFCQAQNATIANLQVNETGVVFYAAATGGTALAPNTVLTTGTYYAALQSNGCESASRLAIAVTVTDPATPTTNSTTQNFCSADNATVANLQVNEANVVFYNTATGGTPLAQGTILTAGTYYAAIVTGSCESAQRLAITVTIGDPATPTTNDAAQEFCQSANALVSNIQVNEPNVIFYTSATGGTPLDPTTALVNGTYYAAIQSGSCESVNRLPITVSLIAPAVPTTNDTTQDFCQADAATIANLQVNETGVVFYAAATGGTALAPNTVLTTGTYYAALQSNGCESASRLAIAVTVTDPATPTTNSTAQNFCSADNATVANLQVNEANVVFYNTATGGTPLAQGTILTAGTYYAAIVTGNCESAQRLAINVTIGDPATPTTNDAAQEFCQSANALVSSIQVNEPNVIFYTSATGGTPLDPTTALVNGTYYAAIQSGSCESVNRLPITVSLIAPAVPTTNDTTQDFCQADAATIANLQVNETGVVFYAAATGGTALAPNTVLATGTYYAALQSNGCESASRLAIAVTVTDPATPTTNSTAQNFCSADNATVANLQVNEANVVFYNTATGGTPLAQGTILTAGTYYAAIVTGNCESAQRLAINVTIGDPATPTTNDAAQEFCQSANALVSSIQVNEPNVIFYTSATGGTPLDPTTALVNGTYYAAIQSGTCESVNRLPITVSLIAPAVPTTNDTTQDFCQAQNATIANLQVNESGVVFYTTPTGGTALASTDVLSNGTYYAALQTGPCESDSRLAITVTVTNPQIPTTNATVQNFCTGANATISNLQVNESNVVFYAAPTGGIPLPANTLLVNGGTYYAATTAGTCESGRLAITVTIGNPATPTTNDTTQEFCLSDDPVVGDLQVNETGLVFYTSASGGTAIDPTSSLASGVYYVAISSGNCESSSRLAITVTIINPAPPVLGNANQSFCASDSPTLSDIQVNGANVLFYSNATGGAPLAPGTSLVTGSYYIVSFANGCESVPRIAVNVVVNGSGNATITGGGDIACYSDTVTYSTQPGMINYVWTVTGGMIVAGGSTTDNTVTVQWNADGQGTISVSYNQPACASVLSATRNVALTVCSDITITKDVNNDNPMIGENVTFSIVVSNNGTTSFSDVIVNELLPSGYLFVSSDVTSGTYSPLTGVWDLGILNAGDTATLKVTVKVLATGNYMNVANIVSTVPIDVNILNNWAQQTIIPLCLMVYSEFTPNNDGQNDFFRIDCIESYPNAKLEIHNRYGVTVYKSSSYLNDWDGTANVNSPISSDKKLPTGTYYYILDIGNGQEAKTGWVYLIR